MVRLLKELKVAQGVLPAAVTVLKVLLMLKEGPLRLLSSKQLSPEDFLCLDGAFLR